MTNDANPRFDRYVGIDYSGAKAPTSSPRGLRVFMADRASTPTEVNPPPSPRKYWTRPGVAQWLVEALRRSELSLVGIDHGFSFPIKYFETHRLAHDWDAFLDDFHHHWPTDEDNTYVEFVRDGQCGHGAARTGENRWRRLTEIRARAKSVFLFDVQGSVAKSTHAGLPWLRFIRRALGLRVHFWPFDGWSIPRGKSAIVEVYPSLWNLRYPPEGRTTDQHDAWSVAEQLKLLDCNGTLSEVLSPRLSGRERTVAEIEGWILGVP
jgi:hypothetical protein